MDASSIMMFLTALPEADHKRVVVAIEALEEAFDVGSIFNVNYQTAKLVLDRAIETAWKARTNSFWVGKGGRIADEDQGSVLNTALNQLHWNVRPTNAYEVGVAAKKFAKGYAAVDHEMARVYGGTLLLVTPVANLVSQAKALVVKGRRPNPEAEARRAEKALTTDFMVRGTCGACFGGQAVHGNGRVHDHGYTFTHWKSGSCPGKQFRPLEISDEAPRYLLSQLQTLLQKNLTFAATVSTGGAQSLPYMDYGAAKIVTKADGADWIRAKNQVLTNLASEERSLRKDIKRYETVIRDWKPGSLRQPRVR